MKNITDQKEAEKKLKRLAEELIRINTELKEFATTASNNLQEPLRMVSSYVSLLEKRYKDKLDQDANDFIEYAVDGANRMKNLIDDLLKYSRVSTKAKTLEPVDCNKVLKIVLKNLKIAIEESMAVIDCEDNLPTVMGDELQLIQLFQNLICNAIKFKKDVIPKIMISLQKEDHTWIFSIKDNGIGFDTAYADKIFVIFQRLHTRADYSGTGIGLSICKKIVERHGGRIWVNSSPGKGSTFYFSIPEMR